jgi:photosystem II stability/assembly factor-like uncharacterized protein
MFILVGHGHNLIFTKMKKQLFPLICFFLGALASQAQWVSTGGPMSGSNRCMAISNNDIFLGTWPSGGVYHTDNNGNNWTLLNIGVNDPMVNALDINGSNIFAGIFGGVYRSVNNGIDWNLSSSGLTNTDIASFAISDTTIFCGTYNGVYRSANNGSNWIEVNNGLPIINTPFIVDALAIIGTNIFAGTDGYGVYRSTDNGANWAEMNIGLTNSRVLSLAAIGTNLFAGTFSGVFRSVDNGETWVNTQSLAGIIINTLAVSGNNIFAGSGGGSIQLSADNGTTWEAVGIGLPNTAVNVLCAGSTTMYAGTLSGVVYRRELAEMIPPPESLPDRYQSSSSLNQNYPNPFKSSTIISWTSSEGNWQTLKVYDFLGNDVATLVDEYKPAGNYKINFDALNLPGGVYFYMLQSGQSVSTNKMILLK